MSFSHGDYLHRLLVIFPDEGYVTVFDVRRRAAIHRFVDDGSYSTTSACVSPNQQYFVTG